MAFLERQVQRKILGRQKTKTIQLCFSVMCIHFLSLIYISALFKPDQTNNGYCSVMRGSCHLDRALNDEIGVEYEKIFVVVFFFLLNLL